MNDYTTNSINSTTFSTGGTTESNDSIEIKKPFLSEKTSKILKVITYFLGILITFIIASLITSLIWKDNTKQVLNDSFDKGYNVGYNIGKTEVTNPKQDQTIDISKAYQYEFKK